MLDSEGAGPGASVSLLLNHCFLFTHRVARAHSVLCGLSPAWSPGFDVE